jgi:dolichol-phosphate mannosyltransferase
LENASGNILVVMDSDFNHRPSYLPFMIQSLSHYDCVSASRFIYGGAMFPRSRHFLSWIFNIFVRILTKGQITDNLYGFFVIKKDSLIKLNFDDIFWGYGDYYIRLLYFLQKNKAEILQVPAQNGRRLSGQANTAFLRVFFQYSIETIKLAWRNG